MKNIFITGATDGIGKLAASKFAKDGHTIFIHGRNEDKLNNTVSEIKATTGKGNIYEYKADFSDLDSVKLMAKEVKKDISKLDILINNAGIFKSSFATNSEGQDVRFLVNYLAPCILTNELLPLLSEDAVIINLSSAAQSQVSLNALMGTEKISVQEVYAQSKLALTMWSHYLANTQNNAVVIAVNPGSLLKTKMVQEAYGQHWAPADKGANILYELALSEEHKAHSGDYFDNDSGGYAKAHPDTYDKKAIDELIAVTNKLID